MAKKKKKRNLQSWKVTNIVTNHGNTHTDSDKTPPLDALRQASLTEGKRQHFYLTIINRAWKRNPVKQWNRLVWPSGSEGKASSSFTDARVTRCFHMVTHFSHHFGGSPAKFKALARATTFLTLLTDFEGKRWGPILWWSGWLFRDAPLSGLPSVFIRARKHSPVIQPSENQSRVCHIGGGSVNRHMRRGTFREGEW